MPKPRLASGPARQLDFLLPAGQNVTVGKRRSPTYYWRPEDIRALRRHLRLTQQELAQELGVRQQTVSEWETGLYLPRGASARMLALVAERASFRYQTAPGLDSLHGNV